MTGVHIAVDDAAVLAALGRLIATGRQPDAVLQAIGLMLADSTRERIRDEETPEGVPFAPLHPLYKEQKQGAGILRESQTLFRTIVSQVSGNQVVVGTNRPHARVHQFGATIRPKTAAALVFGLGDQTIFAQQVTVPARPFLGVSAADRDAITDLIADALDDAMAG
jgi:phage virion morphogenesis protein